MYSQVDHFLKPAFTAGFIFSLIFKEKQIAEIQFAKDSNTERFVSRLSIRNLVCMTGYIYILSNTSMPGLIKIGCTSRSPEERRRELSRPTGIPVDFEVEYEIYSPNIKGVEKAIHKALAKYKFGKEFFKIDVKTAIDILRKKVEEFRMETELKAKGVNELYDVYEAVEILGMLKKKYPNMIREIIKSVRIYQTKVRCYLEILEEENIQEGRLVDQTIRRSDLAFIEDLPDDPKSEDILLFFNPRKSVTENARIFIEEFDPYSIINCTDLFTEEAAQRVNDEYHASHGKKWN